MTLKLFFVQLIFCLISVSYCYGQKNQLINIPVLKEDISIDSVVDRFIAKRNVFLVNISKMGGQYKDEAEILLRDSCLLIGIPTGHDPNDVGIYVETKSKTDIREEINIYDHLQFKYGCFYYKGNYVFVWTRGEFGRLFSKTDRTQTYSFIYHVQDFQTYRGGHIGDGIGYQIKNNAISEHVPTVITGKGNK